MGLEIYQQSNPGLENTTTLKTLHFADRLSMLSFSIEAELALERASGLAIEVKVTSFEEKLPIGPLTFRKSRLMKTTIESVDTAGLFISRLRSRCHPRNYLF